MKFISIVIYNHEHSMEEFRVGDMEIPSLRQTNYNKNVVLLNEGF